MDQNRTRLIALLIILVLIAGAFYYVLSRRDSTPTPSDGMREVRLYYYNPTKDKDPEGNILCSRRGLVAVTRKISADLPAAEEEIIKLLVKGELTSAEREAGVTTEFPLPGFELEYAELEEGILTLTFRDPQNASSGGACRAGILWFQIEATAKEIPGVRAVEFKPEELFQP